MPHFGQCDTLIAGIGIRNRDLGIDSLLATRVVRLPITRQLYHRISVFHSGSVYRQAGIGILPAAIGPACQVDRAALIDIILFQLHLNACRASQVFHGVIAAPHLFHRQTGVAILQLVRHGKALLTDLGIPCGHHTLRGSVNDGFALCCLGGQLFCGKAPT
ncbi:hypothetical protein SDC9_109611 [bioreactor metagenome]|uniref:Uncharacterized protein n=1 Tax=bioreactor metagenome TaxID=1076179 RepID=A0A645BLN9_9ZZZZ